MNSIADPFLDTVLETLPSAIHCGDCLDVLGTYPDDCVDLIVTSPPYADQRKGSYWGIHPDRYVEWFLPRAEQMLRVLKPGGSFVLNIKEKAINGERHTYVIEFIIALRKIGWLWTEEYVCTSGVWLEPRRGRHRRARPLRATEPGTDAAASTAPA